jgi:integrase/recombinase XerD
MPRLRSTGQPSCTSAGSVRGPKFVVTRGKTPVLSGAEMRQLLKSIDTSELIGVRDRALLGLMGYSFARVSAVITLRVEDYFQQGRRSWLRLHEKGGKRHEVPCHHSLDESLDAWIAAAGIGDKKGPLFRTFKRGDKLTDHAMIRSDVLYMIKRRAKGAGLPYSTCCHTFRYRLSPKRRHVGACAANRRAPVATYHQTV